MSLSPLRSLLFVLAILCARTVLAAAPKPVQLDLAAHTRWQTTSFALDSGVPGPVVVILGGVHGNEPAGSRAARQICQWRVVKGQLIVIPRVNVLGIEQARRHTPTTDAGRGSPSYDLNRQFPDEANAPMGTELAAALWGHLQQVNADWVIDLHESRKFVYESTDQSKGLGNSLIVYPAERAQTMAEKMIAAANESVTSKKVEWVVKQWPIDGSLARAAGARLECSAMIAETCSKEPLARRVRYHRVLVHRLLSELGMLPKGSSADTFFPSGDASAGELRVAIYNDTGAPGARKLEICLEARDAIVSHRISGPAVRAGALAQFDAVLFPGGSASKQASSLGKSGRELVRGFVGKGGGCVGVSAGAYLVTSHYDWSLALMNARVIDSKHWARGKGEVEVELTDEARALLEEQDRRVQMYYAQGPLLGPGDDEKLAPYEPLATFRSEVKRRGVPGGAMPGTDAIARVGYGEGRIVAFSPHPESREQQRHYLLDALDWTLKTTPEATR